MTTASPKGKERVTALAAAMAPATDELATKQERALLALFDKQQLKAIDDWIASQEGKISRSEAIRRLVERGLQAWVDEQQVALFR